LLRLAPGALVGPGISVGDDEAGDCYLEVLEETVEGSEEVRFPSNVRRMIASLLQKRGVVLKF